MSIILLLTIERQDRCWNDVCEDGDCPLLYCREGTGVHTFVNVSCLLLEPNEIRNPEEDFDFGIFLDAHKSRIVEKIDFPLEVSLLLLVGTAKPKVGACLILSLLSCFRQMFYLVKFLKMAITKHAALHLLLSYFVYSFSFLFNEHNPG